MGLCLHALTASHIDVAQCQELSDTAGENVTTTKHGFESPRGRARICPSVRFAILLVRPVIAHPMYCAVAL
jgi:hypothetical protein